jgi:hypothetical protein
MRGWKKRMNRGLNWMNGRVVWQMDEYEYIHEVQLSSEMLRGPAL